MPVTDKRMSRYLDMVDEPKHLKKLTIDQMRQLAEEIRHELITVLSKNGGHLGPNLGVVELTLALHHVFETPKDKFVWDVSHQVYVHKLLTGRKDRFHTIRTTNGLNGFALRTESPHDCYGAGHAGTALSAALGMAAARDKRGTDEHVVCIFGDAALTNGISFEALNNIAHTTRRFIGVLNDNEWSIAKNVGAIATYLNKLITHPRYNQLAKDFERFVRRLPKGDIALKLAHKAEEGFKGAINEVGLRPTRTTADSDGRGGYGSAALFEEMGVRYLGPIDGHDLPLLISTGVCQDLRSPDCRSHPDEEGQGLRRCAEVTGEISRDRPVRHPDGRRAAGEGGQSARLSGCDGPDAGEALPEEQHAGRHHGRHAQRHGPEASREGNARSLLRRGHCRGTRGDFRGGYGGFGHAPRLCDLFDVPPAGV